MLGRSHLMLEARNPPTPKLQNKKRVDGVISLCLLPQGSSEAAYFSMCKVATMSFPCCSCCLICGGQQGLPPALRPFDGNWEIPKVSSLIIVAVCTEILFIYFLQSE